MGRRTCRPTQSMPARWTCGSRAAIRVGALFRCRKQPCTGGKALPRMRCNWARRRSCSDRRTRRAGVHVALLWLLRGPSSRAWRTCDTARSSSVLVRLKCGLKGDGQWHGYSTGNRVARSPPLSVPHDRLRARSSMRRYGVSRIHRSFTLAQSPPPSAQGASLPLATAALITPTHSERTMS